MKNRLAGIKALPPHMPAGREQEVHEVICGMLPVLKCERLVAMIESRQYDHIVMESTCTLAQSAPVAEVLWKLACQNNVQLHAADSPDIFNGNPTPTESFIQ